MPSFIKFTNGNETEYVYTSDGVKLKTIQRTAVAGIPDERDMPRLTPQQILSADSTIYIGNFEFYNTLSSNGKYYFPKGFVSLLDICR